MDPTYRLRLATRLHFMLLRRYGQDIDVGHLLKSRSRNQDGLWLCRATGDAELIALARELAHANMVNAAEEQRLREEAQFHSSPPATAGAAPGDLPWDHDTSGFGMLTRPQHLAELAPVGATPARRRWFRPLSWLERSRPAYDNTWNEPPQ